MLKFVRCGHPGVLDLLACEAGAVELGHGLFELDDVLGEMSDEAEGIVSCPDVLGRLSGRAEVFETVLSRPRETRWVKASRVYMDRPHLTSRLYDHVNHVTQAR